MPNKQSKASKPERNLKTPIMVGLVVLCLATSAYMLFGNNDPAPTPANAAAEERAETIRKNMESQQPAQAEPAPEPAPAGQPGAKGASAPKQGRGKIQIPEKR